MPPKRSASKARSRSAKGRAASRSRTPARARTPARSNSRRGSDSTAPEAPVVAPSRRSSDVSMWDADAKLRAAMRPRSARGIGRFFGQGRARLWGYWTAVIVFQVLLIIWGKWAVDMYKTYKASH
ncbi:hypothetical protein NESM_000715400 [Novymonas esmeraldas]|uniref:Uncharacterized protein n=1 Tax=Novymonas esmeraldas TaxID=1808958 RepID=A0AAW0EV28_9TRYP